MRAKTFTLPTDRVAALVAETGNSPEQVISNLLSVLCGRKMWAHLDKASSRPGVEAFIYSANVPTPNTTKARA